MKKISGVLLILILLSISYSANSQFTKWDKEVKFLDIDFKKIHFRLEGNDSLYLEGYLKNETIINGYPCDGFIIMSMNGTKLYSFVLSQDHNMLGTEFPKGTKLDYYKDKTIISFGKNTVFQGYSCEGNYTKWYSVGIHTTLYPSGKLRSFFSTEDLLTIDNVTCKCSPLAGIRLHENEKLKECKLSIDQTINGKQYEKGDIIEFNDKGEVIAVD